MHLHLHLRERVENYGCVYGFWLFSFERYNGILGSYHTNNKIVEMQLMQKFMISGTLENMQYSLPGNLAFMASRRAFLGSRILALILVSICLVNWDFNSNVSFLQLNQVYMLARYHPHRSLNFCDFDFHTLVEERRHFGSSFYRGRGYLSFRISLYPNSVSTFQLNRLIISGDISENPGPDKCSVCTNTVAKNHHAISSDSCARWCHIKCGKVKPNDYKKLQLANNFTWFCPACLSQPSLTSSHSSLLLNTTFQYG